MQCRKNAPQCGCCGHASPSAPLSLSRRSFMATCGIMGAGLVAAASDSPTTWEGGEEHVPPRKALIVKPILTYHVPQRRKAWSWRPWGGVQSEEAATEEKARIRQELDKLTKEADFPLKVLPVSGVRSSAEVNALADLAGADVALVYGAGGGSDIMARIVERAKDTIFFMRHRSGPISLWYEIIHPRYLRQHYDELKQTRADFDDVVIDSYEEVSYRLRALCGLKNTLGSKIVCIGGAGGWGPQGRQAPANAVKYWKLQLIDVPYKELEKIIAATMSNTALMERARKEAGAYLATPGTKLEIDRTFVDRAFALYYIMRDLMSASGAPSITVNACMGTIINMSKTTACLPLQLLNDQGFAAFCESDFVAIPAGILLHYITNQPSFLNNPTYPHDGVITQAHCTGPRRMNGKDLEPARIVTHMESDYGAAPKVEMRKGQVITDINADFDSKEYLVFRGTIEATPYYPICRDQMDIRLDCDWRQLRDSMRGFHWMTAYGDWRREVAYALKKVGIGCVDLTAAAS